MIRVQHEDFDVGAEIEGLTAGNHRIGGVASFIGLVRDIGGGDRVSALTLEHYPGMTERKLAEIEAEAHRRLAQQIPDEQKSALCDYVLTNGGALTELEWQVDQLWPILQCAAG